MEQLKYSKPNKDACSARIPDSIFQRSLMKSSQERTKKLGSTFFGLAWLLLHFWTFA